MLGSDIRAILAEEEEVTRHKDALESLVSVRDRLLRESLETRMRRAGNKGEWIHLSHDECAALHEQEKRSLQSQVDRLRREHVRTRGKLVSLRAAKARANEIRVAARATRQR